MPNSKMFRPVQVGTKKRYTYARSQEVLGMPHLLDLQTKSYEWFCKEGLRDVFADISPIEDSAHKWALHFGEYYFKKEKYSIDECKTRDATYSAPLQVKVQLVNKETGEIKEHDLFMGDFPIMTDTGTFIINGAERVIVSQLVRSPGVYYKKEMDTFGKEIYSAQLIPNRGAWIELETDANGVVSVRIDRNRKMPVTYLIRALGFSSNEEIMELFNNDIHIEETLKKDETQNTKEALIAIYKKLRPGEPATEESGTYIFFEPDNTLFLNYCFKPEFIETMLRNYTYLNTGLAIIYNGHRILSRNGLVDLLNDNMTATGLYPIIHLKGEDIEIAFTHTGQYGEEYYSFVNGQHTTQGGTHQSAFKEHIARTIKEFFNKNMDYTDIRNGLVAAIAVNVEEPIFESQTKTKLGSTNMAPGGMTVNKYVGDFIKLEVDNFLHKNADVAEAIQQKIQESEKERKAIAGVTKLARERAKKANLHNRKLRDCRIHLNDPKGKGLEEDSCIFITEGDSASGSITKSRDVNTQAVFSLRGKPLNSFGLTKKVVYENEEFNLLQAALNIEDGIEGLRYNKVIVATDADVDGMHIRLLLITFFLQFFPDLIKKGHVYILQTPLFRVRNKKKTLYCYSEEERVNAINELSPNPEITRFKGLGEISPDEFKHFIGKDMRLEQVTLRKTDAVKELLEFYMGKNTMERQNFIIDNLVIEEDLAS